MDAAEKKELMNLTKELLSCPTAPFHEERVLESISRALYSHRICFFRDKGGNIVVHLKKGKNAPPMAYIAHTDHPGIDVVRNSGETITAHFLGGVDVKKLPGAVVRLFGRDGAEVKGRIVASRLYRNIKKIQIIADHSDRISSGDFGMFDFSGWDFRNGTIYSRAIDDLLGCAAILNVLIRLARSPRNLNIYGIFTRAEEVGFVGAQYLIAQKIIPLKTLVVSIETSKAYPFAKIGDGPVLRIGDKTSLFSREIDFYFSDMAGQLSKKNVAFRFQRRLMAGGTCEATPFSLAGYRTFGIAFPLGNYHNMSTGGKIRAEYVHFSDFINGVQLMEFLAINMNQFLTGEEKMGRQVKIPYFRFKERLLESA